MLIGRAGIMLCVFGLFAINTAQAVETDWELQRDRDGIQIYTRSVEGSPYDAVRSVTVLDSVRLSALVALVEDTAACPEWADRCAESYVYKRIAANESLIYTHNDMPFPVKDRDVLAHVIWTQNPVTGEVVMQSRATQGELEEVKGRLRLTDAMASWHFRPLSTGAVEVINEAHINPGSALPGWLTNILLVDTPFSVMQSFSETVQQPKYRDAAVEFITEP